MNVTSILKLKGRAVTTTPPTALLIEGARKLAARKIGALVTVGPDGDVVGILSERDVVRAIAEQGPDALNRPISDFMTAAVVTCSEADTLDQLMEQMTARRFRHLPVVTEGALVGIVSIGDVVKHHIAEVELEASAMREYITQS